MSQFGLPVSGRGRPRWSVVMPEAPSAWQEAAGTPSMSGLGPSWGSWVWVGPPLFASGPSSGAVPGARSVVALLNPQVAAVSSSRLKPCDVIAPRCAQFVPPPTGKAITDAKLVSRPTEPRSTLEPLEAGELLLAIVA